MKGFQTQAFLAVRRQLCISFLKSIQIHTVTECSANQDVKMTLKRKNDLDGGRQFEAFLTTAMTRSFCGRCFMPRKTNTSFESKTRNWGCYARKCNFIILRMRSEKVIMLLCVVFQSMRSDAPWLDHCRPHCCLPVLKLLEVFWIWSWAIYHRAVCLMRFMILA